MATFYKLSAIYLTIIPHNDLCQADNVSCVNFLSVGLNSSIRVLIRYSNDIGIEVNCEELLKTPSNSLHWSAISLRTGERTDRTTISSLTLRLKTNLVLLSIISICNSGKLFTNLSVKRVGLTFSCIPCIYSVYIELSSLSAKGEPGVSVYTSKIWLTMLSKIAVFFHLTSMIDSSVSNFSQFWTMLL